jgi:hypothetical protein
MYEINEFENTLRRIIIKIIGEADDAQYSVSEVRISNWKEKREIELKKNKGVQFENRLIFYSDFYDLKTIISKNWELFKPIFYDKKRFDVFFTEIEKYRNSIAHGRNLLRSQENILKGITSDLKNLITIYHNKNKMKEDYFIEILKVTDNLGNNWNVKGDGTPLLRVGDTLELIVEANDPKDRKIEYELYHSGSGSILKQESNRFELVLDNKFVGKYVNFIVIVRTPETEYENKELINFGYTILPK